jgi:hypothetical protein
MNANAFKKNADDPTAAGLPAQNPASQPHGTTQDQIDEMESEGQATKQGQKSSASPLRTQATVVRGQKPDQQKGAVEGDHRLDKEPETRTQWARSTRMGFRKTRKPSRKIPSARDRTKPKDETQLATKCFRDNDDV